MVSAEKSRPLHSRVPADEDAPDATADGASTDEPGIGLADRTRPEDL